MLLSGLSAEVNEAIAGLAFGPGDGNPQLIARPDASKAASERKATAFTDWCERAWQQHVTFFAISLNVSVGLRLKAAWLRSASSFRNILSCNNLTGRCGQTFDDKHYPHCCHMASGYTDAS